MNMKSRNVILGTAALALVAFQAPAFASGDRDTGLPNSSVSSSVDQIGTHGFGAPNADAPDFNTNRDWR